MFGFVRQCVDVDCELSKTKKETQRKFVTPSVDDHQIKPQDFETEGFLRKDAAKVLMKARNRSLMATHWWSA